MYEGQLGLKQIQSYLIHGSVVPRRCSNTSSPSGKMSVQASLQASPRPASNREFGRAHSCLSSNYVRREKGKPGVHLGILLYAVDTKHVTLPCANISLPQDVCSKNKVLMGASLCLNRWDWWLLKLDA